MVSDELFIGDCYRGLLGREPDEGGLANALAAMAAGTAKADFIRAVIHSEEFGHRLAEMALARMATERSLNDTEQFDGMVQSGPSPVQLDALYAGEPANAYLALHRIRFAELFSYLAQQVAAKGADIQVLEVGTAYYTTYFYKRLFPGIRLHTMCRPVATGGSDEKWAMRAGANGHTNLDLNTANLAEVAEQLGWRSRFDVIVCCEVIEHLQANPVDILRGLISMLAPDGELFVTTPNALSLGNMRRLFKGENPAPSFAEFRNNIDAHHHYREYTLAEMAAAFGDAGGHVLLSAYSNAWEPLAHRSRAEYPYRDNLVVVGRRNG